MRQGVREGELVLKTAVLRRDERKPRIVVSKKVAKQAVKRNRIRRVLREAAREELKSTKTSHGLALIVLPGFELPSFEEAKKKIRRLLRKASLRP